MDLTKKQKEITYFLLKGLSKKQIAEKMFVAESTVKTHIQTIMKKHNVHTVGAICGLFVNDLQEEIKELKKEVAYYREYKKRWEALALRELQERRG